MLKNQLRKENFEKFNDSREAVINGYQDFSLIITYGAYDA